ncbi:peroxiredoxin-like family protein [Kordiimonas aquimaris]|uniref:peroxiredoxin-like family protein n=1 Tax=Kordiimonas aquimaris TaxID=707591 RepID=UPI0021CF7883|nr:peroxiredoxin-like family protein [Kordiimonas aquimaris]
MTLTETLAEAVAGSAARIPAEVREVMLDANKEIIATGIEGTAIKTGDKAPDFSLKNTRGETVTLSERLKEGPVVIIFYRGGWCPYCNMELYAYEQELEAIKGLGASLIAITPESPDNSLTTAEKNELSYDVLSDTGFAASDAFGLTFSFPPALQKIYEGFGLNVPETNADDAWRLPIPAAYVIGQDGTVIRHHVDVNYTERLDPLDAIAALKA